MTWKRLPLPVVFVGSLLLSACIIVGYEIIRIDSFWRRLQRNPTAGIYFAVAAVGSAAAAVVVVAVIREVRRASLPEMSAYREALRTGDISGVGTEWPDWLRHDRKVNFFRSAGAVSMAFLGGTTIVNGPWWLGVMVLPGAMLSGREAWYTHRRLNALRESLSPSATA